MTLTRLRGGLSTKNRQVRKKETSYLELESKVHGLLQYLIRKKQQDNLRPAIEAKGDELKQTTECGRGETVEDCFGQERRKSAALDAKLEKAVEVMETKRREKKAK